MKRLLLILFTSTFIWAQDSLSFKTQRGFSLSPISRKVDRVDGLVLGVGHFRSALLPKQTVNGINAELSPSLVAYGLGSTYCLINGKWPAGKIWNDTLADTSTYIRVNGLNISTGGFLEQGAEVRGLNISTASGMKRMSGVSVSVFCLYTTRLDGLSISTFSTARTLNGVSISVGNGSDLVKGMQLGVVNNTVRLQGLQLGVINSAMSSAYGFQVGLINRTHRGFQLGLINVNKKRVMPLINW